MASLQKFLSAPDSVDRSVKPDKGKDSHERLEVAGELAAPGKIYLLVAKIEQIVTTYEAS